jgi:beta-mannosidase
VQLVQNFLSDSVANLSAYFDAECSKDFSFLMIISDSTHHSELVRQDWLNQNGRQLLRLDFSIPNPIRWWCNGMGDPYLYQLQFTVRDLWDSSKIYSNHIVPFGLRTIDLVQEKDKDGMSFYFKINGQPVFMKGANYIPPDNFLPRVSSGDYKNIIDDAVTSHMNMLRIWGGGVYGDDAFYKYCDEKGLLVWQDLMFACAMYPGDTAFVSNVKKEVTDNILRIRNHASLALWCGNNEIDEGWRNWGWQSQYHYSKETSDKIRADYTDLFEKEIPVLISENDPFRHYWPHLHPLVGVMRKVCSRVTLITGECGGEKSALKPMIRKWEDL